MHAHLCWIRLDPPLCTERVGTLIVDTSCALLVMVVLRCDGLASGDYTTMHRVREIVGVHEWHGYVIVHNGRNP
jgi:hypothetical protein